MKPATALKTSSFVTIILGLILLTACLPAEAEPPSSSIPSATAKPEEVLNNSTIIGLKKDGFSDSILVETIKASPSDFDVSIAGLKQLKAAGVSDTILSAMLATKSAKRVVLVPVTDGESAGNPDDPRAPHEAGIWLYDEAGQGNRMTKLEPSVYSQSKNGVGFFMQFGQSVKREAVIRSAHAEIATTNRRPIFYFYFEKTESGLSDTRNVATSPNEYILSQFEMSEKDNNRRLVMGQVNAYAGGETGAEGKSVRTFAFQKLAPGIYKVTAKEDLAGGEYGFFYGGNNVGGKVFDFGIRAAADAEPKTESMDPSQDGKTKPNWFKRVVHGGKTS